MAYVFGIGCVCILKQLKNYIFVFVGNIKLK